MKRLKHIGVGFLVSFVGSLPLGYLNVAGMEIYAASGLERTVWYLLGVISIEVLVIYFTLVFAGKLIRRKALLKFIEGFSVVFMFVLAGIFFATTTGEYDGLNFTINRYGMCSAYFAGVGLSCLNFIQLPFWTGWNVYLLNNGYISASGKCKYFYVLGTAVGTFLGMLAFIESVHLLHKAFFSGRLMDIIAFIFVAMGILQAWKYFRKYRKNE